MAKKDDVVQRNHKSAVQSFIGKAILHYDNWKFRATNERIGKEMERLDAVNTRDLRHKIIAEKAFEFGQDYATGNKEQLRKDTQKVLELTNKVKSDLGTAKRELTMMKEQLRSKDASITTLSSRLEEESKKAAHFKELYSKLKKEVEKHES